MPELVGFLMCTLMGAYLAGYTHRTMEEAMITWLFRFLVAILVGLATFLLNGLVFSGIYFALNYLFP